MENNKNIEKNEIESFVRQLFKEDVESHRNYLEKLLNQLKWAFSILVIGLSSLVVFTSLDSKSKLEENMVSFFMKNSVDNKINGTLDKTIEVTVDGIVIQKREGIVAKIDYLIDSLIQKNSNIGADSMIKSVIQRVSLNRIKQEIFPIGSIIPSSIPYEDFYFLSENKPLTEPNYSNVIWVPADGREVKGSNYAIKYSNTVPDLRGVFLRGINNGRNDIFKDPTGERMPGNLQMDAFQGHRHYRNTDNNNEIVNRYYLGTGAYAYLPNQGKQYFEMNETGNPKSDKINGEPRLYSETRVKNAAVYYYIKVN